MNSVKMSSSGINSVKLIFDLQASDKSLGQLLKNSLDGV